MSHRNIIVLPNDSMAPILEGIRSATQELRIKMFILTDPMMIQALIDARKRGVHVRVMLNPQRTNGEAPNELARQLLVEGEVEVRDANPFYKVSHEKSMVVDQRLAFIHSLNWAARHLANTRDYAVVTTHPAEITEIITCFECDWERTPFSPGATARLIWCPGNGRARTAHFIDNAKKSLFIQNDRYQDLVIIERLLRAVRRGVKVHIMSPPPHALKKEKIVEGIGALNVMHDVGIKIHRLRNLDLHAKLLLADGKRAIIGSVNLTTGSFDERRELAIEVDDNGIMKRLNEVAHHDWKHSDVIDLSDKGLYEELENRGSGGSEKLVLNVPKKWRK